MPVDYDTIADGYDRHRGGGGPYVDTLVKLLGACPGRRVLELGAGTGNNTSILAKSIECDITVLEPSAGMMRQARLKNIPAQWVRGSAPHLPFADRSFDFLFAVYVLHHVDDTRLLFRECARVLEHGCAAFVTAPTEFIANHPMNRFFPSFSAVDLARFQPIEELEASLGAAGFSRIGVEHFAAAPTPVDMAYVNKVAGKFISTYQLLPPEEYEAGLSRLRAEVQEKGRLDTDITWQVATLWAFR